MNRIKSLGQKTYVVDWLVLGLLFLTAIALSLIRIDMTDTPWHLATARLARSSGHWPTTNTFSYTYPDYPLYQQYPIYQSLLYAAYCVGRWEALSVLHCFLWLAVFSMWMLWGGSFKKAALLSPAWFLALLGLQQRMILRPDVLTILFVALLLHSIDGYLKGRTWLAGSFPVIQLLMVNSHQLFPIGLLIQAALLAHLGIVKLWAGRLGVSPRDKDVPVWPVAVAIGCSVLACLLTPLGLGITGVATHTLDSLSSHRADVQEFLRFWQWKGSYPSVLVLLAVVLFAIALIRSRKSWQPFEALLWLMGTTMAFAAVRGVAYFEVISVGIFARSFHGSGASSLAVSPAGASKVKDPRGIFRAVILGISVGLCISVICLRWAWPSRILGGTQPGIGQALGVWPAPAIEFLKKYPPPGRMLNIPWYSGNPLIWELYPRYHVFCDPRFEAYPRSFIKQTIAAARDHSVLEELIVRYEPDWIVGWLGDCDVWQRLAALLRGGEWSLVHADTVFVVLVRNSPENRQYLAAHSLRPEAISPQDFLEGEPDLLALQQIRMAGLYGALGLQNKSAEMIRLAEPAAERYPSVRHELTRFKARYGTGGLN